MHLHLGHRWFGSDGVLAALKTQISKCWLSDLPFIFLPLISTEPIWPSSVAVFVLAVFRCGVHIVSSTSGSSFKSEKSNYILLKDGENMPSFRSIHYRKIRSSDNLWPREQAMIGVTSNQGNVNTSVSEESRACFQFGGGAFVGSWVWGRKTASHISGEIMRPIRLQHRRGTKIAAIKKVKRESRGSEEGGAVLWKLPWTCLFSLSLSRLNPFFTEQGKTCRRRCHFFLSLLLRNVQYSWNPNKTFTCFFFFAKDKKKKKDKSSVVTVQLGLFRIIEAIDDGRCSHWLQLQPLIPVGLKIAARVLISHLFVIQVLFLKCGGGATNSNNRAALLLQNPNKRLNRQRNRTAANV